MKILASNVFSKYKTRDPFEIAKRNNIFIIDEPLGKIQGYYEKRLGQKFIHVNESLPMYFKKYVVAFMLYEVFSAPDEILFWKKKRELKFMKNELEAHKFAVNLIFDEEKFEKYNTANEYFASEGVTKKDVEDLLNQFEHVFGKTDLMSIINYFRKD